MTTTYTFEQLKEDVTKEAQALRVHATKEERERLSLDDLNPSTVTKCIYGLMTGNCFSMRAATLIQKCCKRFFTGKALPDFGEDHTDMDRINIGVNGIVVQNFIKARTGVNDPHYSAIEAYILLPEARNANLIAYLRGETDTLEL